MLAVCVCVCASFVARMTANAPTSHTNRCIQCKLYESDVILSYALVLTFVLICLF